MPQTHFWTARKQSRKDFSKPTLSLSLTHSLTYSLLLTNTHTHSLSISLSVSPTVELCPLILLKISLLMDYLVENYFERREDVSLCHRFSVAVCLAAGCFGLVCVFVCALPLHM